MINRVTLFIFIRFLVFTIFESKIINCYYAFIRCTFRSWKIFLWLNNWLCLNWYFYTSDTFNHDLKLIGTCGQGNINIFPFVWSASYCFYYTFSYSWSKIDVYSSRWISIKLIPKFNNKKNTMKLLIFYYILIYITKIQKHMYFRLDYKLDLLL